MPLVPSVPRLGPLGLLELPVPAGLREPPLHPWLPVPVAPLEAPVPAAPREPPVLPELPVLVAPREPLALPALLPGSVPLPHPADSLTATAT